MFGLNSSLFGSYYIYTYTLAIVSEQSEYIRPHSLLWSLDI